MAYRKVDDTSLTEIADAIREAGGTEESLLFPDDFVAAISDMGCTGGVLTVLAPAGSVVTVETKNLLNYEAWANVSTINGTSVFENGGVTIAATGNDAYTYYSGGGFPEAAKIPVSPGETVYMSWDTGTEEDGSVYIFGNGGTTSMARAGAVIKQLKYTVPDGVTFITFRFGVATAGKTISYKNIYISKSGFTQKRMTKTANADGVAVFKGLSAGTWTLSITDGTQTASKTVDITTDYSTTITFFAATINITYPSGAVCTATDGTTTLTAPDTSGTWSCVVPNAGTWTVSLDNGFQEQVTISQDGEEVTVKWHLYNLGDECVDVTGGWSATSMFHATPESLSSVSNKAPSLTKNKDNLYITQGPASSARRGGVVTEQSFDLSPCKTLEMRAKAVGLGSASSASIVIFDADTATIISELKFIRATDSTYTTTVDDTFLLDIPEGATNVKVAIDVVNNGSSYYSGYMYVTVYSICAY